MCQKVENVKTTQQTTHTIRLGRAGENTNIHTDTFMYYTY